MSETEPLPKKKHPKKEIFRKTNEMDDAQLAETCETVIVFFNQHLAEFTAFDLTLNAAFALNWQQQIDNFINQDSDYLLSAQLQQQTVLVAQAHTQVKAYVNDYKYFVSRAFTRQSRRHLEFGFTAAQSTNVPVAYSACLTLLRVAQDYTTQLTAAGAPAALPANLQNALTQLMNAETGQEYAKRLRIRATTQRIQMFNTLYDTHQRVKRAAEIVFRNNPEVAGQFA